MVTLPALWLPVVLSAVLVFVVSSIIHMALTYHRTDYGRLPGEANVLEAMRVAGVAPGNYRFPFADTMKEMGSPEMKKKLEQGPVGLIHVLPSGPIRMGKSLALWFVYSLAISFLTAYVTGRTVAPGADYLHVFRVAGTVAFLGYAGAQPMNSIWHGQKWSTSGKHVFDGLLYGLFTAGCFGWLWPAA